MSRDIHLHLDFRVTPRFLVSGIAAAVILAFSGELNSESVNLTTYYPAPSGVYTQMLTTGKAFFAQNAATGVGIGFGSTSFPPTGVTGGSSLKLSVLGSVAIGQSGGGSYTTASLSNPNNPSDLVVQGRVGIGTTGLNSTDIPDGLSASLAVRGRVMVGTGVGTTDATRGRTYVYIDNSEGGCDNWPNGTAVTGSPGGPTSVCAAGKYATFAPGIYINGWWYQNRGGQVVATWGSGASDYTTKVWGMGSGGNPTWVELGKNDGNMRIHCCTK